MESVMSFDIEGFDHCGPNGILFVVSQGDGNDLVANIFAAIAAVFGIILLIVTWAVVSAMPVLVVVLFLKLLGVI